MNDLLKNIKKCEVCKSYLPLGPKPVLTASVKSKIVIIGQAPGTKVHKTGVPWDDPSGNQLRKWLGVSDSEFYDENKFSIIPMGFCYPGKGISGDLPPRPECAPLWQQQILDKMPKVKMIILIGMYAQKYYLQKEAKRNLTETVKNYHEYLPNYFVLPHPSPRNRFWLSKNKWFELDVLPVLKEKVKTILDTSVNS